MAKGYIKATGEPACKSEKCVKAKIAAHKGKPSANNKLLKIIDAVRNCLDNSTLSLLPSAPLEDTFGIAKSDIEISDLTLAILNMDHNEIIKCVENNNINGAIVRIMYRLENYLPKNIRMSYKAFSSIDVCCDETRNAIKDFAYYLSSKSSQLEDIITQTYFFTGKVHNLEILKRRYRQNWGDQNKSVEVKTTKEEDKDETVVTINFV